MAGGWWWRRSCCHILSRLQTCRGPNSSRAAVGAGLINGIVTAPSFQIKSKRSTSLNFSHPENNLFWTWKNSSIPTLYAHPPLYCWCGGWSLSQTRLTRKCDSLGYRGGAIFYIFVEMVIVYERQRVSHLFRYGWDWSDTTALIGFDPLTDEVHHLLTAQHIPAHSTCGQYQQADDESDVTRTCLFFHV